MAEAKLTGKRLDGFLCGLSSLVDALPSTEQKADLARELDSLIEYLTDLKSRLATLPTGDETDKISGTIETLRHYVRVAESDPIMSRVLGLDVNAGGRAPRRAKAYTTDQVQHAVEELRSTPTEEMRSSLADKRKYDVQMLRAMGKSMGLRIPSKSTRASTIEQIVAAVGNRSGYEYLRKHA